MTDAETPEALPAPVRRFVDAVNSADTDAFVEAFTEDGYVDDWGACCAATAVCAAGLTPMRSALVRA